MPLAPQRAATRTPWRPCTSLYASISPPHPEGITPECRSVGEVELRFRGTIRPERPHRLSDPPAPAPPLPVAPFICMLAALARAGFIMFVPHKGPSPLMCLRCAWVVPPQAPRDVHMARHRVGVAPLCEVLRILTGAGAASHDRPGWMLGVGRHPEGRFRRVARRSVRRAVPTSGTCRRFRPLRRRSSRNKGPGWVVRLFASLLTPLG